MKLGFETETLEFKKTGELKEGVISIASMHYKCILWELIHCEINF